MFLAYCCKNSVLQDSERNQKDYIQFFKNKIEEEFFYFDCKEFCNKDCTQLNDSIMAFLQKDYFNVKETERIKELQLLDIKDFIKIIKDIIKLIIYFAKFSVRIEIYFCLPIIFLPNRLQILQ